MRYTFRHFHKSSSGSPVCLEVRVMTSRVLLFSWDSGNPSCEYITIRFFFLFNSTNHNKTWKIYIYIYINTHRVIQKDATQLNSKRRLKTRQTLGCGITSSLLAVRVDLPTLRSKLSWILLTFSSDTRGRPEFLPLPGQPICSNWWFQRQLLFLVGGWMLKRRRNARCTAVDD